MPHQMNNQMSQIPRLLKLTFVPIYLTTDIRSPEVSGRVERDCTPPLNQDPPTMSYR